MGGEKNREGFRSYLVEGGSEKKDGAWKEVKAWLLQKVGSIHRGNG